MSNPLVPPQPARRTPGQAPPVVRHACPECGFMAPKLFCSVCSGVGQVDGATLARWQLTHAADWPQ